MKLVYYNNDYLTFAEFECGDESNEVFFDKEVFIKRPVIALINEAMKTISKYGKEEVFPPLLLEGIRDKEVDIILLASYKKEYYDYIKQRLFVPIEKEEFLSFKDIESSHLYQVQAVGLNGCIMYCNDHPSSLGFETKLESFDMLESKYISIGDELL